MVESRGEFGGEPVGSGSDQNTYPCVKFSNNNKKQIMDPNYKSVFWEVTQSRKIASVAGTHIGHHCAKVEFSEDPRCPQEVTLTDVNWGCS